MALIVQKFGGSSVKDRDRIFNVARIVANTHNAGNDVVVVVSAQGDTTDDLITKAAEITHNPSAREMDMLLAAGEEISIALLAMALNELGCHATSLTGWQAGFRTDRAYTKARITKLETERISSELERNRVVVVAGFQGLNKLDDITTLGRGGSDTSAVAIAAALHADRCQIFTDVEGVYTADPRKVRNEPKLDVAYKGYTFTPEDKKNLLQNGNLGKVVDFPDKNTGELRPYFISIDRLTNEIVDIPTNKVRIPDTIGKTPITKDDKRVLYSGLPLRKEIELANGRKFTPLLQVNVEQRGVEFVPGSTRQVQGQKQNGDKKQTADKQEQKAEGDAGGQKKQQDPNHWLNEDGTIRRLNTYFKKELTEQIKEVPNKNGSGTYTAYVKFDFDKMQPRSYRNNPDLKQAKEQIPTNENKVQVAVNEQGKTHEATKHTKDPLSPGQSAPKNEKQQKEQNAEEQKPKRKARSVKM